jgi:hypothetical protein
MISEDFERSRERSAIEAAGDDYSVRRMHASNQLRTVFQVLFRGPAVDYSNFLANLLVGQVDQFDFEVFMRRSRAT